MNLSNHKTISPESAVSIYKGIGYISEVDYEISRVKFKKPSDKDWRGRIVIFDMPSKDESIRVCIKPSQDHLTYLKSLL